ncbi:MAG TPA: anti-sigma factor [Thermoleophilaceae bacterium]|jgi:anti-sigma factor RsiW
MSEPGQLHDDVGAYLLGALEDSERERFERHLADCPLCREELERLRPAVEALPRSVEPLAAPPWLKAALMDAVHEEAGEAKARTRPRRRWSFGFPRLTPVVAWGSAAFLLAVGLGFGLAKLTTGDETRTIAASVQSRELRDASGTLSVPDNGGAGAVLHVSGLPSLPGRVYQAWVKRDGQMIPQPTFEVGRDGVGVVALPADLKGAKAVLLTREPRGGSRTPSERPVMTVRL